MLSNEEQGKFLTLLTYLHCHPHSVYTMSMKSEAPILAYYDTDYESDNGLDEDEKGFEEFQCIVFKKVSDGTLFEVNYHNLPEQITSGGKNII